MSAILIHCCVEKVKGLETIIQSYVVSDFLKSLSSESLSSKYSRVPDI
jgi:hypothetical protein